MVSTTKTRLLVIDDEPILLEMVETVLGSQHDVVVFSSAVDAFEALRTDKNFDLILCDLMMNEMNGMDFYQRLKELDVTLVEKIVFVTGGVCTSAIEKFLEEISNDRIEKPFGADRLKTMVDQLLIRSDERLQAPAQH